mmetsp:Transcript_6885/g.9859  ORF Transcript_6885/g.9859 Transcript_6885/m.9859 type:complete len:141 (+) Transcript_6885:122-544(+)
MSSFLLRSTGGLAARATTPHSTTFQNMMARRFLSSVITLSDEDAVEKFRMLNGKSILYFTASWCPPCKQIKPIYEDLSDKYKDKVAFGKVDVDENDGAAMDFEIQAVPTFVVFHGETAIHKFSGADPNKLESMIQDLESR